MQLNIYTSSVLFLIVLFPIVFSDHLLVHVNTTRGPVVGYHVDYGDNKQNIYYGHADVFLSIPYVQPPIGNLRFAKPQPLKTFSAPQPLNATNFPPMCPQFGSLHMNEDCLYLNIFTPNVKKLKF